MPFSVFSVPSCSNVVLVAAAGRSELPVPPWLIDGFQFNDRMAFRFDGLIDSTNCLWPKKQFAVYDGVDHVSQSEIVFSGSFHDGRDAVPIRRRHRSPTPVDE